MQTPQGELLQSIKFPEFIQKMGHQIVAYILNIAEDEAKNAINGIECLNSSQIKILKEYFSICNIARRIAIERDDVNFYFIQYWVRLFIINRNILNIWHENCGGKFPLLDKSDLIVYLLSSWAIELYPLLLIQNEYTQQMHKSIILFSIRNKTLESEILKCIVNDASLKKLLPDCDLGKFPECTPLKPFKGITHAGGQLGTIPSMILHNAWLLMKMRGKISLSSFLSSIDEMTQMMRSAAEGKILNISVFSAFSNVNIDVFGKLDSKWGCLKVYDSNLLQIIPDGLQTCGIKNKKNGVIIESKLPIRYDFGSSSLGFITPNPLYEHLTKLQDKLRLAFSLAIEREFPVALTFDWFTYVSPMENVTIGSLSSKGSNLSASYYCCKVGDQNLINDWINIIDSIDNIKIEIAISRTMAAINERLNPVDSFLDSIIAWENLFGANAELTFRISIALAILLGEDENDRCKIQREIKDLYNIRSRVVHGIIQLDRNEAKEKLKQSLKISLKCFRKLYKEMPELIPDAERGMKLILKL